MTQSKGRANTAIQYSCPNPKQNTAHEKPQSVLTPPEQVMLQTGYQQTEAPPKHMCIHFTGSLRHGAGTQMPLCHRLSGSKGWSWPFCTLCSCQGKKIFLLTTANLTLSLAEAAAEKAVRKIFVVLSPKALLKAAARAGSFFPEELLHLNPLASS